MKQKFLMPDGEIVEKDFPIFKTPYNHDTNFESDRTGTWDDTPSLTKQEFKDEVDINTIIKRALASGEPPPITLPEHFMDMTSRPTYFEMASKVAEANGLFYELPADKRAEFQNDPNRWADEALRALDRGDADELNAMGIKVNKKPQDGSTSPPGATPAPDTKAAPAAPKSLTAEIDPRATMGTPKSDTPK